MRVAFVTRDWAAGPQGSLQGPSTVFDGLRRSLAKHGMELVHTPIPGTYWNVEEDRAPELTDMSRTFETLAAVEGFDFVLNNEPGLEPALSLGEVEHALLLHLEWDRCPESFAHWLSLFVRFAPTVIAATPSTAALARSVNANVHMLAYPVHVPDPTGGEFWVPPAEKQDRVVWVGRDSPEKGVHFLLAAADQLGERLSVFASYLHPWTKLGLAACHAEVHVGEPRSATLEAMRVSKVVMSTSLTESYATALVEGALLGCVPLLPRALRCEHLRPFGVWVDEGQLPTIALEAMQEFGSCTDGLQPWARQSFAAEGPLSDRWAQLVRQLVK